MKALKPCPFCGSTNVKTFGPYGWYRQFGISHSCQSFYSGTSEMMQGFASEQDAITAWNTRALTQAPGEDVERVDRQLAYAFTGKLKQSQKADAAKAVGLTLDYSLSSLERDKAFLRSVGDAGKVAELRAVVASLLPALASPSPVAEAVEAQWLHMSSAPKDGTLIEIVVDYSDGGAPLHDATVAPTIGFNNLENTGEDRWQFAGWSWEQDCWTEGSGHPLAWRPARLNAYDDGLSPLPSTLDAGKPAEGEAGGDVVDRFEKWWHEYRHCNRDAANYHVKKKIAFDAYYHAHILDPAASSTDDDRLAMAVEAEAQFLVDRIDEMDWSLDAEDFVREWNGHVDPPLCRLRSTLKARKGDAA